MSDFLETLTRITAKEVHALKPQDISFLKARSSYLSAEELTKFKSVLSPQPTLEQLQQEAQEKGIKGAHLYKDIEKLKAKLEQQ